MDILTNCRKERMFTVPENSPRKKELVEHTGKSVSTAEMKTKIKVYVNPLSKTLYVEFPRFADNVSIRIFTIDQRQLVGEVQLHSTNKMVGLNHLPSGFYIMEFADATRNFTKR